MLCRVLTSNASRLRWLRDSVASGATDAPNHGHTGLLMVELRAVRQIGKRRVARMTFLGGTSEARATGINEEGLIVGYTSDSEVNTATIWIDREAVDLNDYLPAGSGWVLTEAREINNHNVVVGSGELNGQIRAFVLSLCDAP